MFPAGERLLFMTMKIRTFAAAALLSSLPAGAAQAATPTDQVVATQVFKNGLNFVGLSVVVVRNGVTTQHHFGEAVKDLGQKPTSNTLYAIGSVTKTFTASLLALASRRGEVHIPRAVPLKPPLFDFVPPTKLQELVPGVPLYWMWKDTTLEQLATYHSGLPRDPAGFFRFGAPSIDFQFLMSTLKQCSPADPDDVCFVSTPRTGDTQYSNYAFAVLGKVLADLHGKSVAEEIRDEITDEVGMYNTGDKAQMTDSNCVGSCTYADYGDCDYSALCHGTFSARAAVGYDEDHDRSENQGSDEAIKAGSGLLWSTPSDMGIWLRYHMGLKYVYWHQEYLDIVRDVVTLRDGKFGLAWGSASVNGKTVIKKDGKVDGFRAFIGFMQDGSAGVVVMSNTVDYSAESLGLDILANL
jgi:serine-type D-Ala-D-Ala carboxypeptidase/endopeptidase